MTTRTKQPAALPLPTHQVRRLLDVGRVTVVIPCRPQPPDIEVIRKKSGSGYGWIAPTGSFDYWRVSGPVWAVREEMGMEPKLYAPYAPGDVVPVKERWADVNTEGGPAFMYSDGSLRFCDEDAFPVEYERYPGCHFSMWFSDLLHAKERKCTDDHKWRSARSMPDYLIRLRPIVETVECRRVCEIDELVALDAAFEGAVIVGTMQEAGKPPRTQEWIDGSAIDAFKLDWSRRHTRPEDAFDRAFGFFTTLRLEK